MRVIGNAGSWTSVMAASSVGGQNLGETGKATLMTAGLHTGGGALQAMLAMSRASSARVAMFNLR
ncbi:hypothetical protein Vgi01_58750 [Micromonospora gifhornensis]|uniref:Uncharacterized protein n=1 Tax=Micromonospora gifhornensis TaxID=84594 RepID=A0ABQ4IN09_9ACTN|nr:hypothetical protein Vgi01_58750 [Micromonospora gifhornensis]